MALPEGWALPLVGQCWDHPAALPGHPQHKLSEQGEFRCLVTEKGLNTVLYLNDWTVFLKFNTTTALCCNVELLSVFQGVGVLGWLVVGEGLPTVRVLPVQRCQKHCSSFNLWLTPGDMGNTCCLIYVHKHKIKELKYLWEHNKKQKLTSPGDINPTHKYMNTFNQSLWIYCIYFFVLTKNSLENLWLKFFWYKHSVDGCSLWPLTSIVYADPRYWQMELFPGRGQNIICDGSAY